MFTSGFHDMKLAESMLFGSAIEMSFVVSTTLKLGTSMTATTLPLRTTAGLDGMKL